MVEQAKRWLFWIFAAVGAYYLITEHRAHLLDYLPYVLLMACPLMHLFHRHGGHRHDEQRHEQGSQRKEPT
jgi:hypothetical protein